MASRAVLLLALTVLQFPSLGLADTPKLSGSATKSEEIVLKCDAVFVGKITQVILGPPSSKDVESYFATVIIVEILRGSAEPQILVQIDNFWPNREAAPLNGNNYIFFAQKTPGRWAVLKLLSATDDNIGSVKKLIAKLSHK